MRTTAYPFERKPVPDCPGRKFHELQHLHGDPVEVFTCLHCKTKVILANLED